MTRLAMSARYIDSFSPWWTSDANSGSPIILASGSLALKSAAVSDAKAVGSNCGVSPTVATSWPLRSTSRAQRAFESRRYACRCVWICLKSLSLNDQLAAPAMRLLRSLGLGHVAPRRQRLRDRDRVGVLEIAPHRQPSRDPRDAHAGRLQHLLNVVRRGLPLHRGVRRHYDLPHTRAVRDTRDQLIEVQLVGTQPLERRQPTTQDVISSPVAPSPLDRSHVRRFLDDAQQRGVAPGIAADGARIVLGEVAARPARRHATADPPDGLRQSLRGLRGLLQQEKREPLRRFAPDTGELGQLRHELLDGRHGGGVLQRR